MTVPAHQFTVDSLNVLVYESAHEMGVAAARMAAEILRAAIAKNGRARVVLATGNSQYEFSEALRQETVDWERVTGFHMDEYIGIDPDHPASFRRWMRERIERPLGLHMSYIDGDAKDVDAECDRYEQLLRSAPIDLVCMGIGENGHLAFNEPGAADFNDHRWVRAISLNDQSIAQQVGEGHFPNPAAVPRRAISLTIPALLSAAQLVVTVPERRKAAAVTSTLTDPVSIWCPATILRNAGGTLFLDSESFTGPPHPLSGHEEPR